MYGSRRRQRCPQFSNLKCRLDSSLGLVPDASWNQIPPYAVAIWPPYPSLRTRLLAIYIRLGIGLSRPQILRQRGCIIILAQLKCDRRPPSPAV